MNQHFCRFCKDVLSPQSINMYGTEMCDECWKLQYAYLCYFMTLFDKEEDYTDDTIESCFDCDSNTTNIIGGRCRTCTVNELHRITAMRTPEQCVNLRFE